MQPSSANHVIAARSVPVGTVSDRVKKGRTNKSLTYGSEKSRSNGNIGKSQTLTPIQKKEAMLMNGFLSQGRISGGKYLVTGTPQGVTNLGFSESFSSVSQKQSVNQQLSYTDELFEGSDRNDHHKHGRKQGHGHFLAHNGTIKASKLTLARRHQDGGHYQGTQRRRSYESRNQSVSQFDIELNHSLRYQYRPGEEISGNIIMEVCKNVEIRFLELTVVGVGTACLNKSGKLWTQRETYIYKRTFVIGNNDSRWTSLLTPGKYVSNFRFKLAKEIPSTLEYSEENSGLRLDVVYFLKARLVDSATGSVVSGISAKSNKRKSIVSRKLIFKVLRPFDINMLPDVNMPVNHTEEVVLSCGNNSTATICVALDRSVFLAGDDIRLQLSLTVPSSRKIKEIICCLQQHVSFKAIGQRATYPLIQLDNKNPEDTAVITIEKHQTTSSYEVTIPTNNAILSSFLYGCNMLSVTYSVKTVIKFSQAGGKLSIAIPIALGPCGEPIYFEKAAIKKAVPVFNRPLRFPCFTPASRNSSFYSQDVGSQTSRNIHVVSQYKVSPIAKCFMCCFSRTDGI